MTARRIGIVGGGITGLATAYEIERADPGAEIVLFESDDRVGGKVRGGEVDGIRVEDGPDSFLPRDEAPLQLCRELGLGDDLIEPADFGAWIWTRGKLARMPEGFILGLPTSPGAILGSRILSPMGMARASADLVLPGPLRGPDVSVGSYVRRRFGREVVERLVDPLFAGTRAGNIDEISLAAAAPQIDAVARRSRSLTLGLRRLRDSLGTAAPRFVSVRGGLERLTGALRDSLRRTEVRSSSPVSAIERGGGFAVIADGSRTEVEGVAICVPAPAAKPIVETVDPASAKLVGNIAFAGATIATFVFDPGTVQIPESGSGFLVPSSEGRAIAGCTWFSSKWPQLVGRDGRIVIRCFAGRSADDPPGDAGRGELVRRLLEEASEAMGITAQPRATRVVRWKHALPQLAVGHLDLMDELDASLSRVGPISVAGAGYRGTGIPDCLHQAKVTAARLLA